MGLEGSWGVGSVDGLCRLPAHTNRAWLARTKKCILRAAGIRAGDIHLAGCELHNSRSSLLCRGLDFELTTLRCYAKRGELAGSPSFLELVPSLVSKKSRSWGNRLA